jgi:hypothetical protein
MDEGRLRAALEHIASGELGVNLCVKTAKQALGPNVGIERLPPLGSPLE